MADAAESSGAPIGAYKNKQNLLVKSRSNPTWWIRQVLGERPWPVQSQILQSIADHRETNVRSGHGIGKSWLASRAVMWFLYNFPSSLVITTAPTDRQVRGILWKEIRTAHAKSKIPLGGKMLKQQLNISPDWMAMGFTANDYDPDKFQGFHAEHCLVVVDEACGISDAIDQGIESILSSHHSRLLRIGNPTNENTPFGRAFKNASCSNFAVSCFDTPNFTKFGITSEDISTNRWENKIHSPLPFPTLVTPHWARAQFEKYGDSSPIWQARVLGQFPDNQDNALIPMSWVDEAKNRTLHEDGICTFGVDIARFGSNETIVIMRNGSKARVIGSWNDSNTMASVGKIIELARQNSPESIFVDGCGVGGGVIDRLKESEFKRAVVDVNVSRSATDKNRFLNERAELFWNLRERFEKGDIDIDPRDEDLAVQLAEMQYTIDSRGKIKIESKDEMRRRGILSPDRADALALAFKSHREFITDLVISNAGLRNSPWGV